MDFVASNSRSQCEVHIVGCLILVAIGMWGARFYGPPPPAKHNDTFFSLVWGWMFIALFGAYALVWARRWLKKGEYLRIGPEGIKPAGWSDQVIPWCQIRDASQWNYRGQKVIILRLVHPTDFPARNVFVGRMNTAFTGGDISISLVGTDRSFEEAMSAIRKFRPRS